MRTHKQILAAIQNVAINGKALDESVQSIGLDILQHVEAYGEVSLANKLLKALPKGARAKALADWFQRFGKIMVNTNKATAKQFPLVFCKEGRTDLEGAAAKPVDACRPDRPLSEEFDFAGKTQALLKQAQKAKDAGMAVKGLDLFEKVLRAAGTEA